MHTVIRNGSLLPDGTKIYKNNTVPINLNVNWKMSPNRYNTGSMPRLITGDFNILTSQIISSPSFSLLFQTQSTLIFYSKLKTHDLRITFATLLSFHHSFPPTALHLIT